MRRESYVWIIFQSLVHRPSSTRAISSRMRSVMMRAEAMCGTLLLPGYDWHVSWASFCAFSFYQTIWLSSRNHLHEFSEAFFQKQSHNYEQQDIELHTKRRSFRPEETNGLLVFLEDGLNEEKWEEKILRWQLVQLNWLSLKRTRFI